MAASDMAPGSGSVAGLDFAARTDPGRKRGHNEDQVATDAARGVALLADGMGGHRSGEVASGLAVEAALTELAERLDGDGAATDDGANETGYSRQSLLARDIVLRANTIVHDMSCTESRFEGMGTTFVVALFREGRLSIAHVGDSRAYRLRGERLEQLTRDHTLLQQLVDEGYYTPEQARSAPNRNVVTRALGVEATVAVDLQEEIALPGDLYLLCSDGLSDMVDDEAIRSTLSGSADYLDQAAERLIAQANDNGGHDNISVVLIKVREPFHARAAWFKRLVDWF